MERFRPPGRKDVSSLRGRGTFARSGKSTQKRCLNLRFKNPRTLFCVSYCTDSSFAVEIKMDATAA